ncbi:MAG: choice-of-anchor B domain-containing protein [Saprospiraceae bacterium]|jgi:choice-of-anchor B domain-containing protein
MRNFTQVFFLWAIAMTGYGQLTFNMELVSSVDNGETGNDIWGYVDSTGVEYAIMGTRSTTKIWSLEDPANPIERASIPGPVGTWRDIKSFEDHIYVTSDQGTDGLLIIDMSGAPDTITSEYWKPDLTVGGATETLEKCHNLYIDTDQGFCYLAGCNNSRGGILILDLNQDKKNPVHVSSADIAYAHDVYVKNDRMYASEIYLGMFNVYDVSDKTNPVLLNGEVSSFDFTHNAWTSDDGNYIFTTDERANAFVESFDISDLDAIVPLDRFKPIETQGLGVIPHNTHYMNGFLITSWYTDGVIITDVNEPDNMVKVGAFDSETTSNGGFNGCWGVYPFLPSGLILATDGPGLSNKLKVYRPTTNDGTQGYQRASYLKGNITDINTGFGIPNAEIEIMATQQNIKSSGVMGDYKTGIANTGTFDVVFSHPNYDSVTAQATLVSGEITTLDIDMGNSLVSGAVIDKVTGDVIQNAKVVLLDKTNNSTIETLTDEDGIWVLGVRGGVSYGVQVAKWGYLGTTQDVVAQNDAVYSTELETGYQDDFFADLGWTSNGNAASGNWEIGDPSRLEDLGVLTQSDLDIEGDIGTKYYVTGASGSTIGENDIDDGSVILTSPMMDFSSEVNRIDISYHLWFANVAGNGPANDDLKVELTNGTSTIELPTKAESSGEWSDLYEVTVSIDDITFNDQMQIIITATDQDPGHVCEAGIDVFNAFGYMSTGVGELEVENLGLAVFPNPTADFIYLNSSKLLEGDNVMIVTDNTGKISMTKYVASTTERFNIQSLPSGIYNVQVVGSDKQSETIRIVKN